VEPSFHSIAEARFNKHFPKWKALSDPEMMLMHVIIPRVEETPAPGAEAAAAPGAAAAAPAEPEVIKKGKTEKEGEEPAATKKEK